MEIGVNIPAVQHYGVHERRVNVDELDSAVEYLRRYGFAIVKSGLRPDEIKEIREAFDRVNSATKNTYGIESLTAIDEQNTIRLPLALDARFLKLAMNPMILSIGRRMIGKNILLNQQNGVINPAGKTYNQAKWHRDLPYQHFVSSRPLAINALFCVDDFTLENGATLVIPSSHQVEEFPSDEVVQKEQRTLVAEAGNFLVLDCMVYHSGGPNRTNMDRRAVNHVYTTPIIRQQIEISSCLGPDFPADAETRQLLGFGYEGVRSVKDYLESRRKKAG